MGQLPQQQPDALACPLRESLGVGRCMTEPPVSIPCGGAHVSYDDEKLVIERPWFDTTPVFISVGDGCAKLARRWTALAPFAGVDLNYVQDYLRYQTPLTRRTFCSEVAMVRNGERWSIASNESVHVAALPIPEPPDQSLLAILEREIVAAGPDAVFHLSSGLDSSLLAIIARRLHTKVRAATFRTRGRGASQELDTVRALAEQFDIELETYDLTEIDLWKEGINLIHDALPYPIAHPSHLARYLLDRRLAETGAKKIVTGRGPDELLAGYEVHGPEFQNPDAYNRRITCTSEIWVDKLFRSSHPSEAHVERAKLVENGKLSLIMRLIHDLHAIFEAWNMIDVGLARCLRVSYVNPFLAPDAAAFMFSRPDRDKFFNGSPKNYLRRNFAKFYPDYLLRNPKVGLTIDIREYLAGESVASIVRRLYDDSSFGQRFLRREGIAALVEDTLSGRGNYCWQIWSLYLCNVTYAQLFCD
jgi:asparagine synthetase B (glutamine-hydrolysing)